jgi:hypothetical protein
MGIGMINKSLVPSPAFQERAKKVYAFSCDDLKEKPIPKNKDSDRIEFSEKGFLHLQVTGKQEEDTTETETDIPEDAENSLSSDIPEETIDDDEEITSESVSQSIGINAGKLARKLAAAKTKAQVQMVIAEVQQDLAECEAGRENGAIVDENSVRAAQEVLNQANQRLNEVDDREATPEEEMAFSLAGLM